MREIHQQTHHVGPLLQQLQRHQRIPRQPPLAHDEKHTHQAAEHDQADDLGRIPREGGAAEVQAQQQHDGQPDDGQAPEPVDGFDAVGDGGFGVVHVEEEEDEQEGEAGAREVDPEDPAPGDELGEYAAEDGADAAGEGPDELTKTEVEASLSIRRVFRLVAERKEKRQGSLSWNVSKESSGVSGGQSYLILNISEMTIFTSCSNPPPAVPCKARPTININILLARAHITELAANHVTAARRMGFRPQMSDSLAQSGAPAALARR